MFDREVEPVRRQAEVGTDRAGSRVQVVAAEGEKPLQRLRVSGSDGRIPVEVLRQLLQLSFGLGHSGAPREIRAQGLAA